MKHFLTTVLILVLSLVTVKAQDQNYVGAGLVLSLPMGDFGDIANTGIGGTGAFEMEFTGQITGIAQIGYISYGTESEYYSFSSVPVLAGVKYYFQPGSSFYGMGKLGLNFVSTSYDGPDLGFFGGADLSTSSSELTLAIGAGYEMPIGNNLFLDASGSFNIISDFNNLQIRVGVKTGI